MGFRLKNAKAETNLIAVLPVSSTVTGFIGSSDIGKLVYATSNNGGLAVGTTADDKLFLGIVAAVPTATTPASTVPFYVQPIVRGALYEADFSTTYSTGLPATTDIGKFLGLPNTTTVTGGSYLNIGTIGNAVGTTSGCFFRINSVNVEARTVTGTFNSTHIATGI